MKTRNIAVLAMLFAFVFTTGVFAQDSEEDEESSKLSISGSVDAYFRANIGAPNKGDNIQSPGSSFANLPGFSLGMANLVLAKDGEKVGFVADLVFGPRGQDAIFGSGNPLIYPGTGGNGILPLINQLNVYWNVSDNVTLTLGNFNTFLGYEVISPAANFNYSTSYMFSYGPFSHTGIKADIAISDEASAMIGLFNPTDATDFNTVGAYTIGAQFGMKGFYLNLLYGDQDGKLDEDTLPNATSDGATFQIDLTGGVDVSETLYLGVNATYNTKATGETFDGTNITDVDGDASGFLGFAGYAQVATSDALSIGARIEYFSEFNGGVGAIGALDDEGDGNVIDITLTGQYKVGDLTIIPEFRLDSASEDAFLDNDLQGNKSLSSFVLAAVYSF